MWEEGAKPPALPSPPGCGYDDSLSRGHVADRFRHGVSGTLDDRPAE
jgi:hypothetical protein